MLWVNLRNKKKINPRTIYIYIYLFFTYLFICFNLVKFNEWINKNVLKNWIEKFSNLKNKWKTEEWKDNILKNILNNNNWQN